MSALRSINTYYYKQIIEEMCNLNWQGLQEHEVVHIAWAYYFFSIQFRENLEIACHLNPSDLDLKTLMAGECDTDNLSPFPGVSAPGEKMNHDEFMRRTLMLAPAGEDEIQRFNALGNKYLEEMRSADTEARALTIASYEDGGLENVFKAILQTPEFDNQLVKAFRFFLSEHIKFDSDLEAGHGALSRNLHPDDRIVPIWAAFKQLFVDFVPGLRNGSEGESDAVLPVPHGILLNAPLGQIRAVS